MNQEVVSLENFGSEPQGCFVLSPQLGLVSPEQTEACDSYTGEENSRVTP